MPVDPADLIADGESYASVKAKLVALSDKWLGAGPAPTDWGQMRSRLNTILSGFSKPTISNAEIGSTARAKINSVIDNEPLSRASLYHDYTIPGYLGGPAPSITRASTKTVFNNAGLLSTVASGALALSDRGLSIEESRTNLIRNNTMQGAVAGSPGALPTNWQTLSLDAGLTREIVSIGSEGGVDFIDVRFSGVPSGTLGGNYFFEFIPAITAAPGQVLAGSAFFSLVAGSMSNVVNLVLRTDFRDSGQAVVGTPTNTVFVPSGTLTRVTTTTSAAGAGTVNATHGFRFATTAGQPIDFTLRIGLPQLEVGAFVTSPILTTSGTVTRAADVITIPSPTSYVSLAQGGAFVEWREELGPIGVNRVPFNLKVDDNNAIYLRIGTDNKVGILIVSGGVLQAYLVSTNSVVAGQTYRVAVRWAANDCAAAMTASLLPTVSTDNSVTMPTGSPSFHVGSYGGGAYLNAVIPRIALWQTGPTNAELQALVA